MIVFLVWMWITNIAVLLGAELNAETERARELEAGVPGAEEEIQAPYRDVPKEEREPAAAPLTLSFPARPADVYGTCGYCSSSAACAVVALLGARLKADPVLGAAEISDAGARRGAALRARGRAGRTARGSRPRSGSARPEAQRLIAEIDGLVEIRTDLPRGMAIGLAEMTPSRAVVRFDLRSLNGDRALDRNVVVLHELGHVIDYRLVPDELVQELDAQDPAPARARRRARCRSAPARPSRSASPTRSPSGRWAAGSRSPAPATGYRRPPSIEDWGAPLGLLAARLSAR